MSVLTVLFDFKNPQCYLALEPTRGLLAEVGWDALWQPLLVGNPRQPEKPGADAPRGDWHRWHRAVYRAEDLRRYAAALAVPAANFDDAGLYRSEEGRLAAAGYLWLARHAPDCQAEYLTRIFAGYWDSDLSLDDLAGIARVIEELSGSAEEFLADGVRQALEQLNTQQAAMREQGFFDVPGYVLEDEVFYGRQHLPILRQRAAGSGSNAPAAD